MLDEGIGNGLHAVQWADDNDGRPSADDEPELPGVLGELIGVVRVSQVLDGVVLDSVTKLFHSLGMLKGGKYHFTVDLLFDRFGISCMTTDNFCLYLQNRLIQTSQTGGQWYSDTSPISIPWLLHWRQNRLTCLSLAKLFEG